MRRTAAATLRPMRTASAALVGAVMTLPVWMTPAAGQTAPEIAVFARAVHPGEVVRLDVACLCAAPPVVKGLGVELPLSAIDDGRWQGLLGIDLDTAPGSYRLQLLAPDAPAGNDVTLDVRPKAFPTRTLRVAPRYVEPPAAETARIVREAAALDALYKRSTPRVWTGPFILPVAATPTSNFGSRSVFNGQPRSPHAGVDFGSPSGTPVQAPAAGTVALASDLFFTGHTVVLDHGAGLISLFAHLSSMSVEPGQVIVPGTTVGRVGATGRATGPHLHWSVRLHGARVDPLSLVAATQADLLALPYPADQSSRSR